MFDDGIADDEPALPPTQFGTYISRKSLAIWCL